MNADETVERGETLCESESLLAHRSAYFVEGFILTAFWAFLTFFLFLLGVALSRGNFDSSFFLLSLWVIGTIGLSWYVIPRFRKARTRVYVGGFILPKKLGVFKERFVSYDDVESAVAISEHRIDITAGGEEHSLTRRDYGHCFEVLSNGLLKRAQD